MITNGTTITFAVHGTTDQIPRAVASVRSDVIDALTPFFDVQDVSITTKTFLEDPLGYFLNWTYDASVRAKVRSDYADIRDIDSVVAHAFYVAAGALPTVTANSYEQGQGAQNPTAGFSLTTILTLGVIALVAIAVIKVSP